MDTHLGAPLDKAQQCSEWEARPLSGSQLAYAAADAVCLLHLLDALVRHAPRKWTKTAPRLVSRARCAHGRQCDEMQ